MNVSSSFTITYVLSQFKLRAFKGTCEAIHRSHLIRVA